ncbi:MAG: hypothetical protein ABSF26_27375 [Thermoguttaceae bacterium]
MSRSHLGIGENGGIDAAEFQRLPGDFPIVPNHVAENIALLMDRLPQEITVSLRRASPWLCRPLAFVRFLWLFPQLLGKPLAEDAMFQIVERFLPERHALANILTGCLREHTRMPARRLRQPAQTVSALVLTVGVIVKCRGGFVIDQEVIESHIVYLWPKPGVFSGRAPICPTIGHRIENRLLKPRPPLESWKRGIMALHRLDRHFPPWKVGTETAASAEVCPSATCWLFPKEASRHVTDGELGPMPTRATRIAQGKRKEGKWFGRRNKMTAHWVLWRSGPQRLLWWLVSLFLGPIATFLIVALPKVGPGLPGS